MHINKSINFEGTNNLNKDHRVRTIVSHFFQTFINRANNIRISVKIRKIIFLLFRYANFKLLSM